MSEQFYLDKKIQLNNDYFDLLIIEGLNDLLLKISYASLNVKVVEINMLVKQAVVQLHMRWPQK